MAHHKRLAAVQRGVLRIRELLCYNKHESPRIGMKQGAGCPSAGRHIQTARSPEKELIHDVE